MTRILFMLYAVLTLCLMALGVPAAAESIDGKTTAQIVLDRAVQDRVNGWALNKFGFAPPDQPCYLTKAAGKRLCSFPAAPAHIAALFTARDFQRVRSLNSWDCFYGRPQLTIILPKVIGRAEANGFAGHPYLTDLRHALAYLTAWQAAQPALPMMRAGGFCEVNIAP
ncbi:MAG: hypothetical protein DCC73_11330 [Proteobacteria bacterium]|nr:MAG: hypothetical protein DCC73_11330 [Pseudomonadota bacterium]